MSFMSPYIQDFTIKISKYIHLIIYKAVEFEKKYH